VASILKIITNTFVHINGLYSGQHVTSRQGRYLRAAAEGSVHVPGNWTGLDLYLRV